MKKRLTALIGVACLTMQLMAAGMPRRNDVVDLPQGEITRIPSPNRQWTLVFECPNQCSQRRLWIERSGDNQRRHVGDFDRSLKISWSPDSQSFFVNDAYGSNGTECYVYEARTLKRTDINALLIKYRPKSKRYLGAGHSYLEGERWISSQELLVKLKGHFDEPPAEGFAFEYNIDLRGGVRKISESREER